MQPFAGAFSFMRRPCGRDLAGVDIAVLGVPYDLGTTNRPGARLGPRAIREQSLLVDYPWGVWPWDFNPFDRHAVLDCGDVAFEVGDVGRMVAAVEEEAGRIVAAGVALLALGGDHFVSLPLLRAHARHHGPLSLVHFDAHSDTWVDDGFNHGSMFYHAVREGLVDPARSVQVGIRTPNPHTHGFAILHADRVVRDGPDRTAAEIRRRVGDHAVYLTFDIDFLDPAYAPGTGTPVVGGPTTAEARAILAGLAGTRVVGGDQVEVSPPYDPSGQITALAGATLAADILYLISIARG
ncbi:MAG: agmatinase [Rhodospirillales bacterium]